jgi:hypothetical protein
MTGAELVSAKIDAGEPVDAAARVVVIPFSPVKAEPLSEAPMFLAQPPSADNFVTPRQKQTNLKDAHHANPSRTTHPPDARRCAEPPHALR